MIEILKDLLNDTGFLCFLGIVIVIAIIAIVAHLYENTLFFKKCAGLYYKYRIKKDMYHYVRNINTVNMSSSIDKTLSGIFKFNYGFSNFYITSDSYKSPLQVQTVFKIFQYVLKRIELLIIQNKSDEFKECVKEILYKMFSFIDAVLDKEDLISVDTSLYFKGINLSEEMKKNREDIRKGLYTLVIPL